MPRAGIKRAGLKRAKIKRTGIKKAGLIPAQDAESRREQNILCFPRCFKNPDAETRDRSKAYGDIRIERISENKKIRTRAAKSEESLNRML